MRYTKEQRLEAFRAWCKENNYKYEHGGFIGVNDTIHGIIETKRGARYYVRARTKSSVELETVVVRSKQNTTYANPNSIRILINNQVLKGNVIGNYQLNKMVEHPFESKRARNSKYVGLVLKSYNSDGSLLRDNSVVSAIETDGVTWKKGNYELLLDSGKVAIESIEKLDVMLIKQRRVRSDKGAIRRI